MNFRNRVRWISHVVNESCVERGIRSNQSTAGAYVNSWSSMQLTRSCPKRSGGGGYSGFQVTGIIECKTTTTKTTHTHTLELRNRQLKFEQYLPTNSYRTSRGGQVRLSQAYYIKTFLQRYTHLYLKGFQISRGKRLQ